MANIKACLSSSKDDWETPNDLFERYDRMLHFTLDAAATADNKKVNRWLGPGNQNELFDFFDADAVYFYHERVWLNPPYGRNITGKWVERVVDITDVTRCLFVVLLPARTDTKWFHEILLPRVAEGRASYHFIKGRVKFVGADHGAPFPSMIATFW